MSGYSYDERNDLAWWFPRLQAAGLGLVLPETRILTTTAEITQLAYGEPLSAEADAFLREIEDAVRAMGTPCFLRTGLGSGKHEWERTCYVTDPDRTRSHVAALIEWSEMVDFLGLPHQTWVVRELIPTAPAFYAFWGKMPITQEFRFFVRDGQVEHIQPYWLADAIQEPSTELWREHLDNISYILPIWSRWLSVLSCVAGQAMGGGYWSVDWLRGADGRWWLTDMALGDMSFRWEPDSARETVPA